MDAAGGRTHPLMCFAIRVLSSASRRHETVEVANTSGVDAAGGRRPPAHALCNIPPATNPRVTAV